MVKFLKILQKRKTGHVNKTNLKNKKHDQTHETGKLKHARKPTEENAITVDELLGPLEHVSQKQTHRSTRQISKGTDLTQYSIVQFIQCVFV